MNNTTQSNAPTTNGTVESAPQADVADLLAALLAPAENSQHGKAETVSPLPERSTPHRSTIQPSSRPVPNTMSSAPDIEALAAQLHRSAKGQNGLVGTFKAKLFGEPLERQQVDDLRRRIGALSEAERTQLATSLAGAIRKAGFVVVTNTLHDMFTHIERFSPDNPAHEMGLYMLERDKTYLADMEDRINQTGEAKVLKEIGFDR